MTKVMWALWVAAFLFMVLINIYASRVTKNEEDQLCLTDSSSNLKSEQDQIAHKIGKIQPVRRTAIGFAVTMTLVVVGYYVLDMVRQFL